MDNDHADDAEEQAQAMDSNQDNDGPAAIKTVLQAVSENRPDILKRLIEEGKPVQDNGILGWTALHHAAFLGRTECLRILLNKECGIDDKALNESMERDRPTPLMAACANLPRSKDCIKILCENKADQRVTYIYGQEGTSYIFRVTALHIAITRKPDLEIVKLLVSSGADVNATTYGIRDPMRHLFEAHGHRLLAHPDYAGEEQDEHFTVDETEVAEIAMYLARQGCVKNALVTVLLSRPYMALSIPTPQLLEKVVECFLEEGAVLHTKKLWPDNLVSDLYFQPSGFSIFAKKSIIYLEGIPTSHENCSYPTAESLCHAIKVLMFQGTAAGILPLASVKEIKDILQTKSGDHLPPNFRPLEALHAMTQNPPSLSQIARTKIRAQMAEFGKFSRENIKKLELTKTAIDFMQLDDLDDGTKVEEIMEGACDMILDGYDSD